MISLTTSERSRSRRLRILSSSADPRIGERAPVKHVVDAPVLARSLDRDESVWLLDDEDRRVIAVGVRRRTARVVVRDVLQTEQRLIRSFTSLMAVDESLGLLRRARGDETRGVAPTCRRPGQAPELIYAFVTVSA